MTETGRMVLRILSEGRISAQEAAVLLAAITDRPTIRASMPTDRIRTDARAEFLPLRPPAVWGDASQEII